MLSEEPLKLLEFGTIIPKNKKKNKNKDNIAKYLYNYFCYAMQLKPTITAYNLNTIKFSLLTHYTNTAHWMNRFF